MKEINQQLAVTQQKFSDFYQQNLREIYTQLEPVRHEKIHSVIIRTIIVSAIVLFVWWLCYIDFISSEVYKSEGFMKFCGLFLFGAAYLIYEPFESYRTTTKNRVMKIILSFWGKFTYSHEKDIIGDPVLKKSEIFTYFNQTEVDDAFWGHYNGVEIDVSEHDVMIHGNKGNTHIFKGALIMLDFPKKFKGQTVVLNKWRLLNMIWNNPLLIVPLAVMIGILYMPLLFMYDSRRGLWEFDWGMFLPFFIPLMGMIAIFAFLYWAWRRKNPRRATQKVALEGLPFMRRWQILTDDQVEARYILTPVFMEKMLAIKRLFHGKAIDFSFFDNKLLIAVHTRKNLFETTSLFVPALSYHKVREVISQLNSIFSVIDVINENKNNFSE
ncbi:MAG: DUF3137 domain-containing protein [Alphaproteobacteria bacterium]|nr:DUF3137 domain-containing protein [Alphaproteobacteria bacterium]